VVVGGVVVGGVVVDVVEGGVAGACRMTATTVAVIAPGVVDVPTTVIRSPAVTEASEAGVSSASWSAVKSWSAKSETKNLVVGVTVTVTVVGVPPGGGSLRVMVFPDTETTVPVTRVT